MQPRIELPSEVPALRVVPRHERTAPARRQRAIAPPKRAAGRNRRMRDQREKRRRTPVLARLRRARGGGVRCT